MQAYLVTPADLPPENRNRLLVHIHGGCYVLQGGEAATTEAIYMAGFGRFKVLSVDYRRPPEFPYPAALDDSVAVWKGALKMADPKNMAIFGTSAGGALTLSTVLRAKQEKLPLPAAIAPGTPMSDLTRTGDSFQTNHMVDNVLVAADGRCDAMARLYANGHDLKDPMLSPVYGDMTGFPPTLLTTGTRDLLLSNTVRVHRKLRQAGVEAELHVYEGQSHAHYMRDVEAPETKEAFEEIAKFFRGTWGNDGGTGSRKRSIGANEEQRKRNSPCFLRFLRFLRCSVFEIPYPVTLRWRYVVPSPVDSAARIDHPSHARNRLERSSR